MKFYSFALALVLGLALVGCHWGLYSATAQIEIRPRSVGIDPLGIDVSSETKRVGWLINSEIQILQTDEFLMTVIQKLNLNQIWALRFKSDHAVLTDKEALDHLHKVLKFEGISDTTIIKITASSEVPQEAADIANAFADNYKAIRDNEETLRTQRGIDSLREQIADQQKLVEATKASVEKLEGAPTTLTTQDDASVDIRRRLIQQQSMLDAMNIRVRQITEDSKLTESPVRILSRAVAPPE